MLGENDSIIVKSAICNHFDLKKIIIQIINVKIDDETL